MRLRLVDAQPLHEPAELLWGKLLRFGFRARPLKYSAFQTFIQQHEAVALPVQCLDAVAASAAEEKQCACEWVQLKLLLDDGCQSVNPASKIRVATGHIHLLRAGEIIQHDLKTAI